LRGQRLAYHPSSRDGFGNRRARGLGTAPEAVGVRPWDESATRMAAVASGRLGYPVAIETARETRAELFLLIDHRTCLAFGSTSQTVQERIVTLGLALTLVALHDGWRVHPVVACDQGFLALPSCAKPRDWLQLHRRLREWPEEWGPANQLPSHPFPGGRLPFPRRQLALAGFCLYSDADADSDADEGPGAEITSMARLSLGKVRVFDPWEQSPPLQGNITLWGPNRQGQENWADRAARGRARQNWEKREERWEKESGGGVFPSLSHGTEQPWERALDLWFSRQGRRWR